VGDTIGNYETSIFVTILTDAVAVELDSFGFGGGGDSEGRSSAWSGRTAAEREDAQGDSEGSVRIVEAGRI
jgi:hypothetical protein